MKVNKTDNQLFRSRNIINGSPKIVCDYCSGVVIPAWDKAEAIAKNWKAIEINKTIKNFCCKDCFDKFIKKVGE